MISANKNIINWNYIKNTTIYQNFIEIKWLIDFRKDPNPERYYDKRYFLIYIYI